MASVSQHRGQEETADTTDTPGAGDESAATLAQDALFDILSNRRRRYVVHALEPHYGEVDLDDLALQVAAWEYGISVETVAEDEHKRVYTALQQSHLPMMDDAGVVSFDKHRGTVEPTAALRDLQASMADQTRDETPWHVYYLGLSTVTAALVAAIWASAWPFTLLPGVAWAGVIVAMFTLLAITHTVSAGKEGPETADEPPE